MTLEIITRPIERLKRRLTSDNSRAISKEEVKQIPSAEPKPVISTVTEAAVIEARIRKNSSLSMDEIFRDSGGGISFDPAAELRRQLLDKS